MANVYMISIGEWLASGREYQGWNDQEGRPSISMSVYAVVQLRDEDKGDDGWVCDSFSKKIGDGHGIWTLHPSQRRLFLWGAALEFQAKLEYEVWPLRKDTQGMVDLRKAIYGKKRLSYIVTMVRSEGV